MKEAVRDLAERAWFLICLAVGRLLRSARYAETRVVRQNDEPQVRKSRAFYAPLLVWLGGPLLGILDTGVRVLPQRDWEERERRVYRRLHDTSIRIDAGGTLVLPFLAGETLARLLEAPELEESLRKRAIERAVAALAELHHLGLTHGDATAGNVLVDPERIEGSGRRAACWIDFETVHDARRPLAWRRADDVRALLATCLVRTSPEKIAETLQLIQDVYEDLSRRRCQAATADDEVARLLAASFSSVFRRPLAFHLAQAGLSFQRFREIARLTGARLGE